MTLYAMRPHPAHGLPDKHRDDDEEVDRDVVKQSKYGWDFLEQAITLWRLVDHERADAIEAIKDRVVKAASENYIYFYEADLRELVRLLRGVEDAIVAAGIVDHEWRVPAERLAELASRVPAMDLDRDRPINAKASALGEIMANAISLRNFLQSALDAGCVVLYD